MTEKKSTEGSRVPTAYTGQRSMTESCKLHKRVTMLFEPCERPTNIHSKGTSSSELAERHEHRMKPADAGRRCDSRLTTMTT